jgi:hypothetical protein
MSLGSMLGLLLGAPPCVATFRTMLLYLRQNLGFPSMMYVHIIGCWSMLQMPLYILKDLQ